jgi:hypothetical protein
MTRLLLDYPWPLAAGLGPDPGPQNALRDYLHLLKKTELAAVRFIEEEECILFGKILEDRKGRGRFDLVLRLIHHCRRNSVSACRAVPTPSEPPSLRESWKRALRDELCDFADWRNPQIVVPRVRRSGWKDAENEITIQCEPCNGQAKSTHHCVLVNIEDYDTHPFALSDLDPWDVRRTAPAGKHPCYLPNPLIPDRDPLQKHVHRVPITQLNAQIDQARRIGWFARGKYFFIPTDDWKPENISKIEWRDGRAFPRKLSHERKQMGYIDYAGRIWVWHEGEDHWDVQLGGISYISVNHIGDKL